MNPHHKTHKSNHRWCDKNVKQLRQLVLISVTKK